MTTAVEAFSRTFLSHGHQRTIVRGKKACNNLPVELLLMIFRMVYDDILRSCPWILSRLLEENFTSASLFPYAIASVCALWRDTMLLEPRFWQRVIIFIDDPALSFSSLATQFSWSRDRQVDVVAARKKFHDNVDRQHERSQVAMVMKILHSHIHRIRELHFDVMFSSSLPSFPYDFHGTATNLTSLKLKCKEDDGVPKLAEPESVAGTENDFYCPQLQDAVIDGRNYYEACRRDARWTNTIAGVSCLTISRFKPRLGESFPVNEFLSPFGTVGPDILSIEDFVLSSSPTTLIPPFQPIDNLHFLECHNYRIMHEIFRFVGTPYDLSFVRCSFGRDIGAIGTFGHVGRLELTEISHELVSALCFWNGSFLSLVDCPHVDDVFLRAIVSEGSGVPHCAPYVRGLSIHGCPNFSVAALRRLVESKLHLPPPPEFEDDWELYLTRFVEIHVSGDSPPFSPQDISWFQDNVNHFSCPETSLAPYSYHPIAISVV